MSTTLENIPASQVSEILAKQGVRPDKTVTVIVDENLSDVARRVREQAKKRGMSADILEDILKDES
jgi:hypothetical protein